MENFFYEVQSKAAIISEVVRAHHFTNPMYVEYDDPDYDVTLLLTPDGDASLLDAAAVMDELEDRLGFRIMIVTPDEYESAGEHGKVFPVTRAA